MKALIGIAIVAAHAAGFAALAARSGGTDLAIDVASPLASPNFALTGTVPPAIAARVVTRIDTAAAGLRRARWSVAYRGDFTREVGATQLVGPFQDPDAPACSGRVVVGQTLLDDGHTGPTTIAGAMASLIDAELRGESIFPIGKYQRLEHLALRWAQLDQHFYDRGLLGPLGAPNGYVRVSATIVFQRVSVPLVIALVPERAGDKLHFRVAANAALAFDNRALQWISDKLNGDRLATRLANRQIDDVLVTTLAPPPPFDLGGGQTLRFTYCNGPIEIVEGAWGALPFAVAIGRVPGVPSMLPPHFEPALHPAPRATTTLAIDLDLDALDAILFELWRTGWLDRQLAVAGLDRRFNADPIVTEYLSVRLSPLRLALPPVIDADRGQLRLAADARVAIAEDEHQVTIGRLFGALDFHFAPSGLGVDLGALELACERTSTTLVPCYADLVAALRDRGADFHGALTDAFAALLGAVFGNRRLDATGLPAELVIRGASPSLAPEARGLHLDLDTAIQRTHEVGRSPGVP